jgi:hypothetical protein
MNLWNWFVAPAFHVAEISFWVMFGVNMLFGLLRSNSDIKEESRFKAMVTAIDACVPEEKRKEVDQRLEDLKGQVWIDASLSVFGQVMGDTLTLVIGFIVHVLAAI